MRISFFCKATNYSLSDGKYLPSPVLNVVVDVIV